jgi:hypothetical protein
MQHVVDFANGVICGIMFVACSYVLSPIHVFVVRTHNTPTTTRTSQPAVHIYHHQWCCLLCAVIVFFGVSLTNHSIRTRVRTCTYSSECPRIMFARVRTTFVCSHALQHVHAQGGGHCNFINIIVWVGAVLLAQSAACHAATAQQQCTSQIAPLLRWGVLLLLLVVVTVEVGK